MNQFSMDELRDMAAAYVLDALSGEEKLAFETALKDSAELAREVAEFRAVIEHIGTAEAVAPPPALRARFLKSIAGEGSGTTSDIGSAPPSIEAPARAFTVSTNKNIPANAAPARNMWVPGLLACALAASLFFAFKLNSAVKSLQGTLASRDSSLTARDSQLVARGLKLAQRDSTLNNLLEADSALLIVHLASKSPNGPGVQVFWNVKQRVGVLHAFHLPPAAKGRAYQLWLIKDGKPVASKVFNSEADQHGLVWNIELPGSTAGVSALAVTEEPESGSLQPTTTPFIVGALPKSVL
ncbi:MAG: anti-sigma factor [Gemmatimonadaceae bacterium]